MIVGLIIIISDPSHAISDFKQYSIINYQVSVFPLDVDPVGAGFPCPLLMTKDVFNTENCSVCS